MSELTAHAFFCDDVRNEIGGKVSLIGVFGPEILVPSVPVNIPSLSIVIDVRRGGKKKIKKLSARMENPGEETVILDFAEFTPDSQIAKDGSVFSRVVINASPFEAKEEGVFKVFPIVDGKEVFAGSLIIRKTRKKSK